jgi:hypothetical protein
LGAQIRSGGGKITIRIVGDGHRRTVGGGGGERPGRGKNMPRRNRRNDRSRGDGLCRSRCWRGNWGRGRRLGNWSGCRGDVHRHPVFLWSRLRTPAFDW